MQKTIPSLNNLKISNKKPILICDADEVIFDFMQAFLIFIKKNKLFFNWKSYALTGNIIKEDNTALNSTEVKKLLNSFFYQCTLNMKLIEGAKRSLNRISNYFNIIILSNIPFQFYDLRKKALIKNNLNFPFFANSGEKGTASQIISKLSKSQTWFIDDSPSQVMFVKDRHPLIKTILFIENNKLAKLVKYKENCDYYSTNWYKNEEILLSICKKK